MLYCPFPMFHIDATVLTVVPAMLLATTAAIGDRFSASGFWDEIRSARRHGVRFHGRNADHAAQAAARRSTTATIPPAGVGRARAGVRRRLRATLRRAAGGVVRIDRCRGADVPPGRRAPTAGFVRTADRAVRRAPVRRDWAPRSVSTTVGEIVIRPNEPSLMSDGYYGMPATSLESRRDLWFHTGDLARRDADGFFYFVGRRTDSIRRRGENISAFEVEEVVKLHPSVLDAAAFGVPSELTEDDVMVAVVVRSGDTFDAPELITFCTAGWAGTWCRVTSTSSRPCRGRRPRRSRSRALRERGVTPTTWDREPTNASTERVFPVHP